MYEWKIVDFFEVNNHIFFMLYTKKKKRAGNVKSSPGCNAETDHTILSSKNLGACEAISFLNSHRTLPTIKKSSTSSR